MARRKPGVYVGSGNVFADIGVRGPLAEHRLARTCVVSLQVLREYFVAAT